MIGEDEVEHGGFIDDQQIPFERIFFVALELHAVSRFEFEQTVNGLGFTACGFSQALGGAPGGGGQNCSPIDSLAELQDRAHTGRFPCTRATSQHSQSIGHCCLDRLALL